MTHDTSGRQERRRYERNEQRTRDAIIFALGIFGSVNELWFQDSPRPYALAFLASVLGIPFILRADTLRRRKEGDDEERERD